MMNELYNRVSMHRLGVVLKNIFFFNVMVSPGICAGLAIGVEFPSFGTEVIVNVLTFPLFVDNNGEFFRVGREFPSSFNVSASEITSKSSTLRVGLIMQIGVCTDIAMQMMAEWQSCET